MDAILQFLPQEITVQIDLLITLLTMVFFFVESFFGYKLIRSWISVIGFLFGAVCGFQIVFTVTDHAGYAILGALICGIILSLLSYNITQVGVFLIAAFGVFQVSMLYLPLEAELLYVASAILGAIAAYLAIKYMRPAIVIITAFHGGIMAGSYLPLFVAIPAELTPLTLGLIIGAAGTLVQFLTSKE